MLSVDLSVVNLGGTWLNVILLSFSQFIIIMLSVHMLSTIMLSVVAPAGFAFKRPPC